jgi:hypothetical protein
MLGKSAGSRTKHSLLEAPGGKDAAQKNQDFWLNFSFVQGESLSATEILGLSTSQLCLAL